MNNESLPKVLESQAKIRFQDCDPLAHLNNSKYIDYCINAREDQLIANYDFDIHSLARTTGKTWVVGQTQIRYVRPALLMETVTIQSRMVHFEERSITVEIQMLNQAKTQLKSLMWCHFVPVSYTHLRAHETS